MANIFLAATAKKSMQKTESMSLAKHNAGRSWTLLNRRHGVLPPTQLAVFGVDASFFA